MPTSRVLPALFTTALLVTALLATALAALAEEELVDGIAAQVGGDIVLVSDVNQMARGPEMRLREKGGTENDVAMLRAEFLERLIERALIGQIVERAELQASAAEIDEAIEAIAAENDLTIEELQTSVESQGLSYEGYRQRIKSEIEQSKVINGMVRSQVRVEEEEVKSRYRKEFSNQPSGGTEVLVRHILVPFDPENAALKKKACADAKSALARHAGGEAFELIAAEISVINPVRGGSLGWIHESELAGWMTDAVGPLEDGQVTDVIEMPFGCNVLQLVERREYEPLTYEQAKGRVRAAIFNEKMGEQYRTFMEDLREKTYIERKGIYAEAARLRATPPSEQGDF